MLPRLSTRTPAPGVMKFTILVDPSLVIITTYLVCLINAWEQRRGFFKKYSNFTLFTPKLPQIQIYIQIIDALINCFFIREHHHRDERVQVYTYLRISSLKSQAIVILYLSVVDPGISEPGSEAEFLGFGNRFDAPSHMSTTSLYKGIEYSVHIPRRP